MERRDPHPPPPEDALAIGPGLTIFLAGVIGVALVGFVAGLGHDAPGTGSGAGTGIEVAAPVSTGDEGVVPSARYGDLRERSIGPNRDFQTAPVTLARGPAVGEAGLFAPVAVTADEKRGALAERAALRAYNGAPPVIPHAVDARSSAACLACHGAGAEIGGRVARPIPHEPFANCLQCHVAEHELFADRPPFAASTFEGLPAPFEGEKAWAGAPPVVPHSVFLRSECNACHGPLGREGLRTSHPWRQNCIQCHALSQERDPSAIPRWRREDDPMGGLGEVHGNGRGAW